MKNVANQRTWTFPRHMLSELLGFTALIWAGGVAFVAAVILVVAAFRSIEISGWEQFAHIAQFYVAFIGGYVTYTLMPLYIAHGRTRHDFTIQTAIFIPIFAAASALLITVGYALEWALYSVADWPQDLQREHLFASATSLPLIFVEYLLVLLTWTAAGALIGAGFYRSAERGMVALVLALIPIFVTSMFVRSEWGPVESVLDASFDTSVDIPLGVAILASVAASLLALGMTWLLVRDMPIRSTPS